MKYDTHTIKNIFSSIKVHFSTRVVICQKMDAAIINVQILLKTKSGIFEIFMILCYIVYNTEFMQLS